MIIVKLPMRVLLLLLLAGFPLAVWTQTTPPDWVQDAYRESAYPAQEWYTGFVRDRLQAGVSEAGALKALERNAQNQLAENIIVTIKGNTQVENTSRQIQNGSAHAEVTTTDYRQSVRTATMATTVRTEMKSCYDPTTNMLYAFAAARRADLAAYYQKQIDVDLGKVETAITISEQLVSAGKKMSARRKIADAKEVLGSVTFNSDLLVAVNPDVDESSLQTKRSNDLQQKVAQLLIDLEQSTLVYMDCSYEFKGYKDDAFSNDPGLLCDIIGQALSENECSVTDNKEEADYELTLTTSTTQRSDGKTGQYAILSYYANVKGSLYNRATQKQTVTFSILNDPDCYSAGRNPEDAATKAFKLPELKNKVLEKILPKIKN
ncbi:MAG: hypothetical protein FWD60_04475 [Candidatus Azobacteroides sp.]|nr:hypothetical protein [Candidatus Azobacteroides sp.]